MNTDIKEYCSPLFTMVAETVRSMQSLRGWASISVNELAIELEPIVATTVFSPLFSGDVGTLSLKAMICDALQEKFRDDEVEVANGTVYFFPRFTADFSPDAYVAESQNEYLTQADTSLTAPSAELLTAAERFIAKVRHSGDFDLDPHYVAHIIKNGIEAGFMTLEDIEAIPAD